MRQCLALLCAVCQLALAPGARVTFAMKTGILLRVHVIAHDDTPAMQQVKYAVYDAACAAYAGHAERGKTMLDNAQHCLPEITAAASAAAKAAGFTGSVTVTVEQQVFDTRTLDGYDIPAGEYPALMIRLGSAQGRNCWGLIDPELALRCAAITAVGEEITWDWSLAGLWQALGALFDFHMEGQGA